MASSRIIISSGVSKKGGRERNEDCFSADDENGLYVVADGMGGARGGRLAARMLTEGVTGYMAGALSGKSPVRGFAALLRNALRRTNSDIFLRAEKDSRYSGMGTTAVVCLIRGDRLFTAWAGDSRACLLRSDSLHYITKDHSLVQALIDQGKLTPQRALHHPGRNVITRAVGVDEEVEVDTVTTRIRRGDIILISTDGVHGALTEKEMRDILVRDESPARKTRLLTEEAIKKGDDNATALVISIK